MRGPSSTLLERGPASQVDRNVRRDGRLTGSKSSTRQTEYPHRLLRFIRRDRDAVNVVKIDPNEVGPVVPSSIFGNFLEHLSCSTQGGISAELLSNSTFSREHNLTHEQIAQFLDNGRSLVEFYLSKDPAVLRQHWTSTPLATGFGVAVLDDARSDGLPFGWAPLGAPASAQMSVGRLGGAVRLIGRDSGIRQGIILPIDRCRKYSGSVWLRIASDNRGDQLEIGLRRRNGSRPEKNLCSATLSVRGSDWQQLRFEVEIPEGAVARGEPVDFYLRWLSRNDSAHLLVDRLTFIPHDAIDGFDPDIVGLVRESTIAHLRWPGGNFVSHYHWRDGVGPIDRRPTYPNRAWGGLEYNLIGTDEYIKFCRLTGVKPYITVNSGTGTPEEAAAWVEYCNGPAESPMGALRAANGNQEPYDVRLWEVGNENFASWQGGYVGSDENARRFAQFAKAMRAASPVPIELIACGNNFDFADPGPAYDQVTADRHWHDQLLKEAPEEIDYISLHSIPMNDQMLEGVTDKQAHEAVLAQLNTWERRSLPALLHQCDDSARGPNREPIRLAISEWGPLGAHPNRLMVENFGAVVYAGTFLNFMIRNSERIPIASPNGFMHGGCIRKALGIVFVDPQVQAIQEYTPFIGTTPLACELTGPGYDVSKPADLGAVEFDVPYLDVIACRSGNDYQIALANRHLTNPMDIVIKIPGQPLPGEAEMTVLTYPEITARTTPAEPDRFPLQRDMLTISDDQIAVCVPPFSVAWIRM